VIQIFVNRGGGSIMIDTRELRLRSQSNGIPLDRWLREEIQKLVLRFLSERRFFTAGVFRGGTALRLCYQGPRFSEDLDFVFRKRGHQMFGAMDRILEPLPRFIRRHAPEARDVDLKRQKDTVGLRRFRLRSSFEACQGRMSINLEICNQQSFEPTTRILRVNPVDVPLVVETEREILADKLVALALRDFLKGRDLWDIAFLTQQRHVSLPPQDLLLSKAAGYGVPADRFAAALSRRQEKLRDEGPEVVEVEMARFLPPHLWAALTDEGGTDTVTAVRRVVRSVLDQLERRP
jgi:predicted nucleotidyltransferase component of viral defense system